MRTISVEPEQVEASAARMDDQNQSYQRTYAQLFEAVDTMKSGWQGKDNTAFSTRIGKFESDFREMSVLCTQYSEFLKNSARAYREMQDDLAGQAGSLAQ
jgi:WXG100 family type VII secretion target